MSEAGDFELFSAPAAKEADEKGDEQFREQMAAAQAGMQALQKEEGQARVQDTNIAKIIVGFLSDGHTDLFLLISRCVGQNIPSELILAVLSLVDKRSFEEVAGFLRGKAEAAETSAHLVKKAKGHFTSLSADQKKEIDDWVHRITTVAVKRPQKCLESLVTQKYSEEDPERIVREISPVFIQLSAFIMRNYFTSKEVAFEFDELYAFMQTVYVELIRQMESLVAGQKKIAA